MAYELQRFLASGETAYISKHNQNAAMVEGALNALIGQVAAAAGGGSAALPVALRALFGTQAAVVGAASYQPTIDGLTLRVAPGYAWLPAAGVPVGASAETVVNLSALPDGTHYLTADGLGVPKAADTAEDALYSVVKGGGALSAITRLAAVAWGETDWAAAQVSTRLGAFTSLDGRLEAIEGEVAAIPPAPDLSGYQVTSQKGAASGYAGLGADGKVPAAQLPASATGDYILRSEKGAADGVATLDSGGKVPLAQMAFRDLQFPFFWSGKPGNSQLMWKVKAAIAFTLPQNLTGSVGDVGTPPTATTTLDLQVNGVSKGSVSISTGGVVTFTFAAAVNIAAGDVLKVIGQAAADATCADISVTLYGTR